MEEYLLRLCAEQMESTSVVANREEERFFVGLRLMAGVRPEPAEWCGSRSRSGGLWMRDYSRHPAAVCA